jgi:alkanesulfonate monooxygenase SsuD/methylene tetrahydromethanopterin reductase-like flavin-dependent oxidoreductase (luciferase family)
MLRFGAFVPQGWKLELMDLDAATAWATAKDVARQAEAAGYDHLWVYDHVETVPRREPTHVFEAWMMMAALAEITDRVELGQLVTCASYRNAGMLAKQAACVDVASNGRLIFGIGAGWYHEEYASYGYEYLPDRARLAALEETILAVRQLWTQPRTSFDGVHVQLVDALCDPKPLRAVPVWIGGGGEQVTLRIAARLADATNWQVGLEGFIRKSGLLERYCAEIDRPFEEITRTHGPDCRLFDTEADLQRWLGSPTGGHLWGGTSDDDYVRNNFVGTVEKVAADVQSFVDNGCREFVLWFRDYPGTESMRRFMAEVVPRVSDPTTA